MFSRNCKHRYSDTSKQTKCRKCGHETEIAGPLWIGKLFDKEFVTKMKNVRSSLTVHKRCERILDRSELEADLPATYYTLDEIASKMNSAPLKLSDAINKLTSSGFKASTTSLNPSGFRTDCEIEEIIRIFQS